MSTPESLRPGEVLERDGYRITRSVAGWTAEPLIPLEIAPSEVEALAATLVAAGVLKISDLPNRIDRIIVQAVIDTPQTVAVTPV